MIPPSLYYVLAASLLIAPATRASLAILRSPTASATLAIVLLAFVAGAETKAALGGRR